MTTLHFNAAPTKWAHSPLAPAGALIPLCGNDGDRPEDTYTLDPTAVTCPDCRREMYAAWEQVDERRARDAMLARLVERRLSCPVIALVTGIMDGVEARMDAAGVPKART